MDSIKKKTAISGIRMETAFRWFLNKIADRMISMITQDRFRIGTNTNRKRRTVNPESIRLNPNIKSYLPPIKRKINSWVKKIVMALKIFSFSSRGYDSIVHPHPLLRLSLSHDARVQRRCKSPSTCSGRFEWVRLQFGLILISAVP